MVEIMGKLWKKEQGRENGNSVPFQLEGIGTRISEVSRGIGTRKKAANIAGVSTDTLQRYISEDVKPSFEPLARLCIEVGASLEWLATGKGTMQPNMVAEGEVAYQSGKMIVNTELLQEVLETVETVLQERGCELRPDKKSELISIIYEEFSQEESEPDTNKIVRLINLAS